MCKKNTSSALTVPEAKELILSKARAELNYHETGDNLTKYASAYDYDTRLYGFDMNGLPWCDYFVDWLFMDAFGFDTGSLMLYQYRGCSGASCAASASYFRANGAFITVPEVGDQIFFYVNGDINHTGIVEDVSGGYVTVIEGNSSDAVQRNVYRITDPSIAGYGRPDWTLAGTPVSVPLETDGEFGPLTKARLNEILTIAGLPADGICRIDAWNYLFDNFPYMELRSGSEGDAVLLLQLLLNFYREV
ncbi:MAG: CHAP domain-containing protein [Eubacteriales bacterium]|nr:CHAP domain-containing protein [Eubacteriales bacterium]